MSAAPKPHHSFLQAVQDVTGFNDAQLGVIAGIGRSTVQAYRSGRLPEYLNGRQVQALKRAAYLLRDGLVQGCEELDMMS